MLNSEARRKLISPETVLDMMNLQKGETLLDIGAGTGYFAVPALEYVGSAGKVIAADISAERIAALKKSAEPQPANFEILLCGAKKIDLPDACADRILMAFVFHEVDDRKAYLSETRRLLKERGELTIVEWAPVVSPMGPPLSERIDYSVLAELAEASGFRSSSYTKLNEYQYLCILTKK
jgi:ubiquinone/menaquinone biosynthesis C-methylase UbiE